MRVVRVPEGRDLPLPARATAHSAGFDLRARVDGTLEIPPGGRALVPTGLRLAIPDGFEVQVRPRSGLAIKSGLTVVNAPGTIDSDYRGELKVLLVNLGTPDGTDYWSMRRYLNEFLSDKRVIDYPSWLWQPLLQLGEERLVALPRLLPEQPGRRGAVAGQQAAVGAALVQAPEVPGHGAGAEAEPEALGRDALEVTDSVLVSLTDLLCRSFVVQPVSRDVACHPGQVGVVFFQAEDLTDP